MKIELENVDSLKDFKKQYYSLVDNTPPQDVKIVLKNYSKSFKESIDNEVKEQIKKLGLKQLNLNKTKTDYTKIKLKNIWFSNYGHICFR